MEIKNKSRRQAYHEGPISLAKWDNEHKPPMYGDDISREWIYMLEDKLCYVKGVAREKIIKYSDFKEVIDDWEKLKNPPKPKFVKEFKERIMTKSQEEFLEKAVMELCVERLDQYPVCPKCGSYDVRIYFWGDDKFICLNCGNYFENNI